MAVAVCSSLCGVRSALFVVRFSRVLIVVR